jgi:hypothetical protein
VFLHGPDTTTPMGRLSNHGAPDNEAKRGRRIGVKDSMVRESAETVMVGFLMLREHLVALDSSLRVYADGIDRSPSESATALAESRLKKRDAARLLHAVAGAFGSSLRADASGGYASDYAAGASLLSKFLNQNWATR